MAGHQLTDALEQRLAMEAELERQIVPKSVGVGRNLRDKGHQRLDLGSEIENATVFGVVEGLDAKPVPRAEHLPGRLIPQGESEHAAQVLHAVAAPFAVALENDLRVGMSPEVLHPEFFPELDVVVDLSIEGDPVSRAIVHRLVAGTQINDAQPPMGEAGAL